MLNYEFFFTTLTKCKSRWNNKVVRSDEGLLTILERMRGFNDSLLKDLFNMIQIPTDDNMIKIV